MWETKCCTAAKTRQQVCASAGAGSCRFLACLGCRSRRCCSPAQLMRTCGSAVNTAIRACAGWEGVPHSSLRARGRCLTACHHPARPNRGTKARTQSGLLLPSLGASLRARRSRSRWCSTRFTCSRGGSTGLVRRGLRRKRMRHTTAQGHHACPGVAHWAAFHLCMWRPACSCCWPPPTVGAPPPVTAPHPLPPDPLPSSTHLCGEVSHSADWDAQMVPQGAAQIQRVLALSWVQQLLNQPPHLSV